ncbi:MAG: MFS transporter [Verrucomicrobiaceae bacterium]|nr:MAG: MFS transporter [Verrucomicrobiaceae bacterium]
MSGADLSGNPRRFIRFGVFYNARAYYPVLAILFLDLGLTLDEFVLLNLIWAAVIFLFEVPSGALADTIGRKKLLVSASVLMVVEMLCLLLAPRDGGALLFGLCVLNRVCSGLSEACASGADEALAYDSLDEADRADSWDKLLATSMRWRSTGYVIAMVLGGLIYDPEPLNKILPASLHLTADIAHRLPVALVLCQSFVCLATTLRMVEPPRHADHDVSSTLSGAFRLTLRTARWVFTNPHTRVVVIIGLAIDCIDRNFATITSSYYRLIELPEWSYGIIGSGIGVIGWFVPGIAKKLNTRFSTLANLGIAAVLSLVGLAALVPAWPIFGLLPATLLMTTLGYLAFTVSRALHREADSSKRATVLSVKGLAFNLGYGLFSFGFSRLLAGFPAEPAGAALRSALFWQIPAFALAVIALFAWASLLLKRNERA